MSTPAVSVSQVLRQRGRRRQLERRSPLGRLGLAATGLACLLVALAVIWLAGFYISLLRDLPSIDTLPARFESPNGLLFQPTRLYDRSGQRVILALENPDAAGRQYLRVTGAEAITATVSTSAAYLPSTLITATLAASDPGFWLHPGFTLAGLVQGAHPTLAQRLVDEHLLAGEPSSLRRALRERLLAAWATRRFGRAKILEWYLNSADYGRLAYGADAAARVYFGKPAAGLSLGEAAMLAAVAEAPALNPIDAPQAAMERQKLLIQGLLRYRTISPEAGVAAARERISLRQGASPGQALGPQDLQPQVAPAFSRLVLQQLESQFSRQALERGRLRILTTLDSNLQAQADCAAQSLLSGKPAGADCPAGSLLSLPAHPASSGGGQAEVVVLDPATGQVLTLSGPPAAANGDPLPAHPAGTLVTPFIYLTAFARGLGPASLVWDIPAAAEDIAAPNLDGRYHGPLRLRLALANDYLTPAAHVLQQVGAENTLLTAGQLGLDYTQRFAGASSAPGGEALPAGSQAVQPLWNLFRPLDLLEISHAYASLANRGILAGRSLESPNQASDEPGAGRLPRPSPLRPVTIQRVEDVNGSAILDWAGSQTRPIAQAALAYLMNDVLSDEPARWPSLGQPNILEIGRPAAVKPGYTPDGQNSWIIGYTPQRLVGVWLGGSPTTDPLEIRRRTLTAGGLWNAVIRYASQDLPVQAWETPGSVSEVQVCDPSGLLPGSDCPNTVKEVFLAGSEPTRQDNLYRSVPIDRQTGRLATLFTPPDLIEQHPYLIAPPEARAWALQTGLEAPPIEYDTLPGQAGSGTTQVQISAPEMFAIVRGKTPILGSAGGDGFSSYRLQIGQGFSPQAWYQVGQDSSRPVENGQLGEWDTSGLNGLYAIQLVVTYHDKTVRRVTHMVSVDNQPPQIRILNPNRQAEITPAADGRIVLQTVITDDLGVKEVTFSMDGRHLDTLIQAPFALSWQAAPGQHSLQVSAVDLAGNTSQQSIAFTVTGAP